MVLKILLAVFATVILFAAGAKLTQDEKPSYEEWKNRHSLRSVAKRAKAQGKAKVIIPGPRIEFGGENMDFQEALQHFTLVVAEPLESKSYVSDADHVVTWYRCSIREILSVRPPPVCDTCPTPDSPPPDMSLLGQGEFLLFKVGGTAVIDGIEITMKDVHLPELTLHKQYLMFVSMTANGTATLGGGPTGIFGVSKDDDLEAMAKNTRLKSDLQKRFGLKLSRLRANPRH